MRASQRRGLGIAITGVYLLVYIFFATSIGGLFAAKPWWAQIAYFAVAGIVWVFPLRPLFQWMRVPDNHELPAEAPPSAAVPKKRR